MSRCNSSITAIDRDCLKIFSLENEVYDVLKEPRLKFFVGRGLRGAKRAEIEIFSSGNEVYEVLKEPRLKFSRRETKSRGAKRAEIEIFSSGNEV